MSDKPVCPDCKRTVFSMPVLRDEQAGLRCMSVYQGAPTPDCHAATVARAERADAALAASYAAWRVANDEIAKLLDERDEWRGRAVYAETELSAALGLPPAMGPAPGESSRIVQQLRERALTLERERDEARATCHQHEMIHGQDGALVMALEARIEMLQARSDAAERRCLALEAGQVASERVSDTWERQCSDLERTLYDAAYGLFPREGPFVKDCFDTYDCMDKSVRRLRDGVAALRAESDALRARIGDALAECAKHDHRSDAVGLYVGQVHAVLTGDKEPNE